MAMNLDAAIRIAARITGQQQLSQLGQNLRGIGGAASLTDRQIGQLNRVVHGTAAAAGNSTAALRNHLSALQTLRDRADIGGKAYNRLGVEIDQLRGKLRGLDGQVERSGATLRDQLIGAATTAGIGQITRVIIGGAAEMDQAVRTASAIASSGSGNFTDIYRELRTEIEAVAAIAAGTPVEVANLAVSLSRAGFSTKETSEALRGIVAGAEATGITFEQMGSIVADTLRQFGISTTGTGRAVDVLVDSANSANQTVQDVGEAMKYAAPIAHSLGFTLEDTAAAVALLAESGIRGSDAGTALRQGLQRLQIAAGGADSEILDLTRGNKLLAEAMTVLGSKILDVNGKLKPLDQVILGLKASMEGLSMTDKAILAKTLFGVEAGSKFIALMNQSSERIKAMFGDIRDAGGEAETTQKNMQGFAYAMKVLGGNVQIVTNAIGDAFIVILEPLVGLLNNAVYATQSWPEPLRDVAGSAAAAGIAVGGLAIAIKTLGGITAITASLRAFTVATAGANAAAAGTTVSLKGMAAALLLNPWTAAIAGVTALTVAAYKLNEPFKDFVDRYPLRFKTFWGEIGADVTTLIAKIQGIVSNGLKAIIGLNQPAINAIKSILNQLAPAALGIMNFWRSAFSSAFEFIELRWRDSVANMISYSNPLLSVLKAAGIDVGAAAVAALTAKTGREKLKAAGVPLTHQVGDIVYDMATGLPISGTKPFVPGADSAATAGATTAAGLGADREKDKKEKKTVQQLLGLSTAEITAAVNTAIGEYGGLDPRGRTDVFANILARSRSGQYPRNLVDVVMQKGQYAPNFGRTRAQVTNPNLYGKQLFDQVRAELLNANLLSQSIQDVDSRLFFKGVSQQKNMIPGVDFLRAPDQNFFHGPGRSDPGRNPKITAGLLRELGGAEGGSQDVAQYMDRIAKEQQADAEKIQSSSITLANARELQDVEARILQTRLDLLQADRDNDANQSHSLQQLLLARNAQKELADIRQQSAAILADKELPLEAKKNKQAELRLRAAGVAMNLDFGLLELENKRLEIEDKRAAAAQESIDKLIDEQELLNARLNGAEAEVILRQQLRDLTKKMTDPERKRVEDSLRGNEALRKQKKAAEEMKQLYGDIGMSIKDGVVSAIQGAIDGTKSLQEVASNLLQNIANKLLDVAINLALFGAMSGTGKGGGLLGFLYKGNAKGGVYAANGIVPFAKGGLVTAPTLFPFAHGVGLMGEAGPEAIMPLRRLPSGRLGVEAAGGAAGAGTVNNVVVNVDATGSQVQGDQQQGAALGRAISVAVQAELVKQQRPGGLLAGTR